MVFLPLLLAVCPKIAAQEFSPEDAEVMAMISEADLGIERVYIDERYFYYQLPSDLVFDTVQRLGAMEWEYDGQAILTDQVSEGSAEITWVERDYSLTSMDYDPDEYFGVGRETRVDQYGRRWLLQYVEIDEARALRAEYDAEVLEMFDGVPEWEGDIPNPGIEFAENPGMEHRSILTSWDTVNCGGSDRFFDHSGNGPMTQLTAASLNDRQRKIVQLYLSGSRNCTGTMVDDEWVLTAAHCLTNATGVEYTTASMSVCTMENLDSNTVWLPDGKHEAACFRVAVVQPNGLWDGEDGEDNGPDDDYGLVQLITDQIDPEDGPPVPGNGWMALASADDTYIDNYADYLRGYPQSKRDCTSNTITLDTLTTVDNWNGGQMYFADGTVQGTPAGYMKYDTSGAPGVSGSPHIYCPNGTGCADGHYITGVTVAYNLSCPLNFAETAFINPPCASGFGTAKKARDIRDWVINNTP